MHPWPSWRTGLSTHSLKPPRAPATPKSGKDLDVKNSTVSIPPPRSLPLPVKKNENNGGGGVDRVVLSTNTTNTVNSIANNTHNHSGNTHTHNHSVVIL